MSNFLRQTSLPGSFESPYVSLGLLSYMKCGQNTPFQIFNEVVLRDFQHHLSKKKKSLPTPEIENDENGDMDNSCCSDLHGKFEEIQKDLIYIKKACGEIKEWEEGVNSVIKDLILQSLDDAFKERTEGLENSSRTKFLQYKINRTLDVVSTLKELIFSQPELSSVKWDFESFKRSGSGVSINYFPFTSPVQLPELNIINKKKAESSTGEEIRVVYDGLDCTSKLCLLCFSLFPENAIVKKKVLVHWWIGEGFTDSSSDGDETAEQTGNRVFKNFIKEGIIEPVHKKRRPNSDNCKMQPAVRYTVIKLAKEARFLNFDQNGNPTADFCVSRKACLVKTEEGSSLRDLTYGFHPKPENIHTLFNVNEPFLDFRVDWFSKMKFVKVLQLGRWQASAKHLIQVEDTEFLKGLKKMRHLRYFSLRGISRITELPDSVCKLTNLRILNLNGCHNLEKLPEGIGSLNKLTHLDMSECYLISHMPKGLALLSELQVLKGFVIGKRRPGGQYCGLADLAKLKNLRKLSIHVDKAEEGELSSLKQLESVRSLTVAWSRIYNPPPQKPAIIQKLYSMYREKSMKTTSTTPSTPRTPRTPRIPVSQSHSAPVIEKLGLQYYPESRMPEWLESLDLRNLKKLYIRGGDQLTDLATGTPWTVKILRLKFLSKLRMDWRKLKELFPDVIYMEKVKCPKLSLFPCDENGEWTRAVDSEQD